MIVDFKMLSDIRNKHPDKTIVFGSGCFDLLHPGHILYLEDCKKHGDVTVIEVACDANLKGYKREPIFNEQMRLKIIDSLKCVDYCFLDPPAKNKDLLAVFDTIFQELKPDKYVCNEDALDIPGREIYTSKHGVEFNVLKRWCPPEFGGVSTSGIIRKIRESDSK